MLPRFQISFFLLLLLFHFIHGRQGEENLDTRSVKVKRACGRRGNLQWARWLRRCGQQNIRREEIKRSTYTDDLLSQRSLHGVGRVNM
ncbi:hypothetical protein ABFA07_014759 [Porites harrisoni]